MTSDRFADIDISVALRTLHKLELQDGDLGRDYWRDISDLLRDAASYRQRALVAEEKLRNGQTESSKRQPDSATIDALPENVRRRIAEVYTRDVARMQRILMKAGKDVQVDEIVSVWAEYSTSIGLGRWSQPPKSDEDLLMLLLGCIKQ